MCFETFLYYLLCPGRNQILLSLCPQIFGMYVVKLAVALILAGGVQRIDPNGTKVRGKPLFLWLLAQQKNTVKRKQ